MVEQRSIGALQVSLVGLGCNNFGQRLDEAQTARVVHAALDAGITLFDTADIYGGTLSEEYLGKALGSRRDEVVIATKFGLPIGGDPERKGAGARWIAQAIEDSLRRLGTDRIDLYQLHMPDPETPIAETLDALDALVKAGKVRQIGNSNFSGEQIAEADRVATERGLARFVCAQNHYNLLTRQVEDEVLPAVVAHGLSFLPYFPLASGLLTGKYALGEELPEGARLTQMGERAQWVLNEENLKTVERLREFATARGRTLLEIAFSWLASRPSVASVIAGATTPEQVAANTAAISWHLDAQEMTAIDEITG